MESIRRFVSQFEEISDSILQEFAEVFTQAVFGKGDFIIREGEVCNYLYFLEQGSARAFFLKDDKEVTTWFAFPYQTLTSYYSFTTRLPSLENIQTLQETHLYAIHYDALQSLYTKHHVMERLGRKITEYYYQWQEERIFSLQFHSARERYENLLLLEPDLLQRVSLRHIASYLGIAQETLSRIRKQ